MDRITNAFAIPFMVIPGVIAVAVFIGFLLHRFDGLSLAPGLRVAPFVALGLVVVIMLAGFVADRMAGPGPAAAAAARTSGRPQRPPRRRR